MKVMVLRSRKLKRVLYIECGKEFADLLLSLLVMPVGAILKLLDEAGLSENVDQGLFKLYTSFKQLETSALSVDRGMLVDPATSSLQHAFLSVTGSMTHACINVMCENDTSHERQICDQCLVVTSYCCNGCTSGNHGCLGKYFRQSYENGTCQHCGPSSRKSAVIECKVKEANTATSVVETQSSKDKKGFVRENITFIIKENLSIEKSTTIAGVALLRSMKVNSFQDLDTMEFSVGREEGLLLVRAALVSETPLTDVFETLCDQALLQSSLRSHQPEDAGKARRAKEKKKEEELFDDAVLESLDFPS